MIFVSDSAVSVSFSKQSLCKFILDSTARLEAVRDATWRSIELSVLERAMNAGTDLTVAEAREGQI